MLMKKQLKRLLFGPAQALCITGLWPVERMLLRQSGQLREPVCFIIGPPRSGTTLIYEILVRCFNFAYISNLAHRLYTTPVAATTIGRFLIRRWQKRNGLFQSKYGHICGWGAPNEGGWWWNQWFPEDYYLDESYVNRVPIKSIRSAVAGLCKAMNGPFINKNVMHSVHMRLLDRIFPNCLFIHVYRDPAANIRSIIRAQMDPCSGATQFSRWWSVKPREWEQYKNADPTMRAVAQVYHIHKNIENDTQILGTDRRLEVHYEEVCRDTQRVMNHIAIFLQSHGVNLVIKDAIPEHFGISQQNCFDNKAEQKIQECMNLFNDPSP